MARLGERGHAVGPNLASVRHKTPDEVLTSILDPNREVSPEFLRLLGLPEDRQPSLEELLSRYYPGELERVQRIGHGHDCNVSRLALGVHSGTHVDAPAHFLEDGATAEQLPLEALLGPAQLVEVPGPQGDIGPEALNELRPGTPRVLFRTRNSELWRSTSAASARAS